jgi:hypothetical protein
MPGELLLDTGALVTLLDRSRVIALLCAFSKRGKILS